MIANDAKNTETDHSEIKSRTFTSIR
jgi:hypothetical protein